MKKKPQNCCLPLLCVKISPGLAVVVGFLGHAPPPGDSCTGWRREAGGVRHMDVQGGKGSLDRGPRVWAEQTRVGPQELQSLGEGFSRTLCFLC